MAVPRIDLERRRGDTFADRFTIKKSGTAISIAGKTFCLSVNLLEAPAEIVSPSATEVFKIVGVIFDEPGGIVDFAPSEAQSDPLDPETDYFFDIQMTEGTEKVTVAFGNYAIVQDICKD